MIRPGLSIRRTRFIITQTYVKKGGDIRFFKNKPVKDNDEY